MSKKYLVTNTTVKEVYYNEKNQDARSALERRGHAVKIDDNTTIGPGQQTILETVTNGQLKLMQEGYISIVEKEGIGAILAQNAYNSEKSAKSNKKTMQANGSKVSQMGDTVIYDDKDHVHAGKSSISADPRVVKPRSRAPQHAETKPGNNKKTGKGKKVS